MMGKQKVFVKKLILAGICHKLCREHRNKWRKGLHSDNQNVCLWLRCKILSVAENKITHHSKSITDIGTCYCRSVFLLQKKKTKQKKTGCFLPAEQIPETSNQNCNSLKPIKVLE